MFAAAAAAVTLYNVTPGDVGALKLMADALADSGIERLTSVNWQAVDRWGDTPLQVGRWS